MKFAIFSHYLFCVFLIIILNGVTLCRAQDSPKFSKALVTLVVSESESPGYFIADLSQYVQYNDKAALSYSINSAGNVYLDVSQTNGTVSLKRKLDRENIETHPIYYVTASVLIRGDLVEATIKLLLVVTDENDNTPTFSGSTVVEVSENSTVGSTVMWLSATDKDRNEKGEVNISFALPTTMFGLTSFIYNNTAKIILLKKLDYEQTKSYTLKMIATDLGVEHLTSSSLFTINVSDVGDTNPVFVSSPYNVYVPESMAIGSGVLKIQAFDGDTGINHEIVYRIIQRPDDDSIMFSIDIETGVVSLERSMDRDTKYTYSFMVQALEKPDMSSSSNVSVVVFPSDVNDNSPTFLRDHYVIRVDENTPVGSVIKRGFQVNDADVTSSQKFFFSLNESDGSFSIDPTTGYLSVNTALDYETKEAFSFTVIATETGTTEKHVGNATITVEVQNTNDNQPAFESNGYLFEAKENVTEGYVFGYVKANDADKGSFGVVAYEVVGESSFFTVNSTSGAVQAKSPLDYDTKPSHEVTIAASDTSSFTANSVKTTVVIRLTDVNDNVPLFTNLPTQVSVEENVDYKDLIVIQASDLDSGNNAELLFTLSNATSHFAINATTGMISILSPFDYESIKWIDVAITVRDQSADHPLHSTSHLTVIIKDLNDNAPTFNQSSYTGEVKETPNAGAFVLQVFANDNDDGSNGELMYTITNGNNESVFSVSNEGRITTLNELDRERKDFYELTITVSDKGVLPLKSSCQVLIQVLDANDERPIFSRAEYIVHINESALVGSHVITLSAHDKDLDKNGVIVYSILSGNEQLHFEINDTTGVVRLSRTLDRELKTQHRLVMKAQDKGENSLWRTVDLIVHVIDNNDNPPVFTTNDAYYTFNIYENFPKTSFGFVSASDPDGTSPSYHISAGNEKNSFTIDETSGAIGTNKSLDRETKDFYNLTITAMDNGSPPLSSSIQCHVKVLDLNDNQPRFDKSVYRVSVFENETANYSLFQVFAVDADDGTNGVVTFTLQDDNNSKFSMSPDGVLTLKKNSVLDYETTKEYRLNVIAQDSGTSKLTSSATIIVKVFDVNDNRPLYSGIRETSVYEAQPAGTEVLQVHAEDIDTGVNAEISYYIVNVSSVHRDLNDTVALALFRVNSITGVISTKTALNRDIGSKYEIVIKMEDHGSPFLWSYVTLTVNVLDWNTHAPVFHNLPAILNISAMTSKGIPLYQLNTSDADLGENAKMNFRILSGSRGHFRIDPDTGVVGSTSTSNDRASDDVYELLIQAGVTPLHSNSTLTIHLVKDTDSRPTFEPDPNMFPQLYVQKITENFPLNRSIIELNATHHNVAGGVLKYSIAQDEGGYFQIDEFSGVVTLKKTINREQANLVLDYRGFGVSTFVASIASNEDAALTSSVKVTILIEDLNDNIPQFGKDVYVTAVPENSINGHLVAIVTATDEDLGYNGQVTYDIISGNDEGSFSIPDKYSGKIVVSKPLNKEETSQYNLTVQATDEGIKSGESSLSSYAAVLIYIGDVNDNNPEFLENAYTANLQENVDIGHVVVKVTATDKDDGDNGRVRYEIVSGNLDGAFWIDDQTGKVLVDGSIDRETISSYKLIIQATDYGFPISRKSTVNVFITITDVNDNKPQFGEALYTGTVYENQPVGSEVDITPPISSKDADVNNILKYYINDTESRFEIHPDSGIITTATILDRETVEKYFLSIRVQDQNGFYTVSNVSIVVQDTNDNAPSFNHSEQNITASEGLAVESVIYVARADDLDVGTNSRIIYSLAKTSNVFEMLDTGELQLISPLDWETTKLYTLNIIAKDSGSPPKQSSMILSVMVTDTIDSKPYFVISRLTFRVIESTSVNTTIFKIQAADTDLNDVLAYNITSANPRNIFHVNKNTGDVSLVNQLDRELQDSYTIHFQAIDSAGLKSAESGLEVSLIVLDANDNAPSFLNTDCRIDVTDETPDNSMIYIVSATDADLNDNGDVRYSLSADVTDILTLNSTRGIIRKSGDLTTYTSQNGTNFVITAHDNGIRQLSTTLLCVLNVINVGTDAPRFSKPLYEISLNESIPVGAIIGNYPATMNSGSSTALSYSLFGGQGLFEVNSQGSVYTTAKLDRETLSLLVFSLLVSQETQITSSTRGVTIFTVSITDINDNSPQFSRDLYSFDVPEDANESVIVGIVSAFDADIGYNGVIQYGMQPSPFSLLFRIDANSGAIYPSKKLDRETNTDYEFTIRASDHGIPSLSTFVQTRIHITDVNDNAPVFEKEIYHVTIPEDTTGGTMVMTVKASDRDVGKNNEIVYSITAGNEMSHFVCGEISGKIFVARPLDLEIQQNFTLVVNATDKGVPPLTTAIVITIQLTDVNDEYPAFTNPEVTFDLFENSTRGTLIGQVQAFDRDVSKSFSTVYYAWKQQQSAELNSMFLLNKQTGDVTLNGSVDFEERKTYGLVAIAFNEVEGNRSMVTESKITIDILDNNDNAPSFAPSCCSVNVSEDVPEETVMYEFQATDRDGYENNKISYMIQYGNKDGHFYLSSIGVLTLKKPLNREASDRFVLRIKATDSGRPPLVNFTDLFISVIDINDEAPVFRNVSVNAVPENSSIGTYVTTFVAKDNDLGINAEVWYSIFSGNENGAFSLNSSTGVLKTARTLDYEKDARYQLKIEAKDSGIPVRSSMKMFTIQVGNVNDNEPSFPKLQITASVIENAPAGTLVTIVEANDADDDVINYFIIDGNNDGLFALDSTSGILTTTKSLDRELKSKYILTIEATNQNPAVQQLNNHKLQRRVAQNNNMIQKVQVNIADQNDNEPRFVQKVFSGGVSDSAKIGTSILQIQAIDADAGNSSILIYDMDGQDKFSIDKMTGWIRSEESLKDFVGNIYNFDVSVKDNGGNGNYSADKASVKIIVLTDAQKVLIVMRSNPDLVRSNRTDFEEKLRNCTGYVITIDEIGYQKNENGGFDFTRTVLYFHGSKESSTETIAHRDDVIRAIDRNNACLEKFFQKWNVTKYTGELIPLRVSSVSDDSWIIIGVVIACLIFIFIVIVVFARRMQMKHRRSAKVSPTAQETNTADRRQTVHIHPLSSFKFDDGSAVYQSKESYTIPEDIPEVPDKEFNERFRTFHGTLEEDEEDGGNYLETIDQEMEAEDIKPDATLDRLTLLDVIAKQEVRDRLGLLNKGAQFDDDDAQSQITEATESIMSEEVYDDVITVPIYRTFSTADTQL